MSLLCSFVFNFCTLLSCESYCKSIEILFFFLDQHLEKGLLIHEWIIDMTIGSLGLVFFLPHREFWSSFYSPLHGNEYLVCNGVVTKMKLSHDDRLLLIKSSTFLPYVKEAHEGNCHETLCISRRSSSSSVHSLRDWPSIWETMMPTSSNDGLMHTGLCV